jgi:hypothetical protein
MRSTKKDRDDFEQRHKQHLLDVELAAGRCIIDGWQFERLPDNSVKISKGPLLWPGQGAGTWTMQILIPERAWENVVEYLDKHRTDEGMTFIG